MCGEAIPAGKTGRGLPLLSHATRASPRRSPFEPQTRTDPRPPTRPRGARTQRARRKFIPFSFSEKLLGTPDAAIYPRYGARQSRVARYRRCGCRAVLGVLVVLRTGARAARASKKKSRAIPALNPWVIHEDRTKTPLGLRIEPGGILLGIVLLQWTTPRDATSQGPPEGCL